MKTVSTKVDESVYQKLAESCGKSGNCISERIRGLIEKSLELDFQANNEHIKSKNEFESHYDRFGNYFRYDRQTKRWMCKMNPKNVRITN